MVSTFLKLDGNTVKNRIWSFLIVHSEFDYSMRDIAKYSKVSYTAMKELWKEFIKRKMVIHTRNVGKAKMYKLNIRNPVVSKFIDYYWAVISNEINKTVEKESRAEHYVHTMNVGIASAKNV